MQYVGFIYHLRAEMVVWMVPGAFRAFIDQRINGFLERF
jgi:hypothetical protein